MKKYKIIEVKKDWDGDLYGEIKINYRDDVWYTHEFTFDSKDKELTSISFGERIPFISKIWDDIESELKTKLYFLLDYSLK